VGQASSWPEPTPEQRRADPIVPPGSGDQLRVWTAGFRRPASSGI